uniref:PiggyBac transposable element-derived protein domain-containing protein n=1 Tax=Gouania willdenowi TaxID=441366 RepID=A0A8C5HAB4_GOUWI
MQTLVTQMGRTSTFSQIRIRTLSCLQMTRLLLIWKRELGWRVSPQRRRKRAQCGMKNMWVQFSVSLQWNRTLQMESQQQRPEEESGVARRRIRSRLQSFLCFITVGMLRPIQEWTIQHARQTEQTDWFMILHELMAFISVIILRGVTKVPSLRDSWSACLGNPLITGIMSRNRFQDIMRHLRFDDMFTRSERVQTDKFAAISDVWGSFVTNCITCYNPGRHITIDEQLFPSKTRCCFLQYIATKPDKFGIKFWVACDLKTKYICNVLPYLGKDPSRPSEERLSESVVMKLMEPFMDKGRTVTTDNFFTSLTLARRLLSRKTTILGTVNKIRREIPQSTRKMDRKEFTTQVCCWSFLFHQHL